MPRLATMSMDLKASGVNGGRIPESRNSMIQGREKLKRKEKVSQRVKITSYDLLVFTNRGTSGRDYDALCEAIDRLAGTRITTNIRQNLLPANGIENPVRQLDLDPEQSAIQPHVCGGSRRHQSGRSCRAVLHRPYVASILVREAPATS
jgi:hypothetical protein